MFQFTDDCKIGIRELDDEHRKLFQMINETLDALSNGDNSLGVCQKLLQQLKDYAATHFAHEEAYMARLGDKELPRQKREHAQFTAKIESYELTGISEEESRKVANDLLTYIAQWLYRHIIGSDTMIGKHPDSLYDEDDAFAFTDKYRTGIEFVDEQHERLFEIIRETNDLIESTLLYDKYDQIIHILNELKDYTIMHFQAEEAYMEKIRYDGLPLQRIAHNAFIDRLNEINLDDVDNNQRKYLDDILQFLLNWLVSHILRMDMMIPNAQ